MSHRALRARIVVAAGAAITACSAVAEVVGVAGGSILPPASLGPYTMTRFPADSRTVSPVIDVPSPLGGQVMFSEPMYIGRPDLSSRDSYFSYGRNVRIKLPENTRAFYFTGSYVGHGLWSMSATTDEGTSISQLIYGYGRGNNFGFYVTDPDDPPIRWIDVKTYVPSFAVGEFGIAIPEPASAVMLLAAMTLGRGRRVRNA